MRGEGRCRWVEERWWQLERDLLKYHGGWLRWGGKAQRTLFPTSSGQEGTSPSAGPKTSNIYLFLIGIFWPEFFGHLIWGEATCSTASTGQSSASEQIR